MINWCRFDDEDTVFFVKTTPGCQTRSSAIQETDFVPCFYKGVRSVFVKLVKAVILTLRRSVQ